VVHPVLSLKRRVILSEAKNPSEGWTLIPSAGYAARTHSLERLSAPFHYAQNDT